MKRQLLLLILTIFSSTIYAQNSKVQLRMAFDTVTCDESPQAHFTFQMRADSVANGEFVEISDMNFRIWYDNQKMIFDTVTVIPPSYNEPVLAKNDTGLVGPFNIFGFDDDMGFIDYTISVSSPSAAASISNSEWTNFLSLTFDLENDFNGDCLQVVFSESVYGDNVNIYTNSFVKIVEVVDGTAQIAEVDITGSEHWNWQDTMLNPIGDCLPIACDTMPGDTIPTDTMNTANINLILDKEFSLSPNPTNQILNISSDDDFGQEEVLISIFNNIGQQTLSLKEQVFGTINHQVDVGTWNNGVYFIQIQIDNKYKYLKFIKN
jgi:hypothetical protein